MSDLREALQKSVALGSTLSREAEAARTLLLNLRDVIADDEAMAVDMIEAETGLIEAVDASLTRLGEIDALAAAIGEQAKGLATRKTRLEVQAERIRTALCLALGTAGVRKLERPLATVSLRSVAPSVVIVDEANIPSQFWKSQPPKLDKKLLGNALRDGDAIPGAQMGNGSETISIKRG